MLIDMLSSNLIAKIVRCVEDAVGDDILADIQQNELETRNSIPFRVWDLLNKNILKTLDTKDCVIARAHRGPWEMLIIFERTSQCIITFMREKRFSDLQKRQRQRKHLHYIDILAKQFNKELLANQQQLCLFPHKFSDEDQLAELVQNLLSDLGSNSTLVRNHILVLFDTVGFQLTHIRAVMVTPSLDIANGSEHDWSRFISANESVVVEKVNNSTTPGNQPGRGLSLTAKAIERKKDRPQTRSNEKESTNEV